MKHDIKTLRCKHTLTHTLLESSTKSCQGKDNLLCEGSSRQRKDYSPPISIKHTGDALLSRVCQWWCYTEFNALWLLLWLLMGEIHRMLLFTLEMNDSLCDMFPEESLCPQPVALADSLVICTSRIRGRRVSLRHNICYSLFQ